MGLVRVVGIGAAAVGLAFAMPASAQFFLKHKDLAGDPVRGDEPGIVQPMPGATPAELQAALTWSMRAALNVAALQCQFEPTLLTVDNYNAILTDHKDELKSSFDVLTKYFLRVNKVPKAGQTALDQFGTRTYSSFATVAAQYGFCQTAHAIGRDVVFTPRGEFGTVAKLRMRELRNSLTPWGEQSFPRGRYFTATLPRLDMSCWSKKGEWNGRCGADPMPGALGGVGIATR